MLSTTAFAAVDGAIFTTTVNGTTVNGQAVPRQGHGPACELSSGADVRLGQVDLTFLDSAALVSFALRMER